MNQIYHDMLPIGHEHHEQDENSPLQGLIFSTIPGSRMRRAIGTRPVTGKQEVNNWPIAAFGGDV